MVAGTGQLSYWRRKSDLWSVKIVLAVIIESRFGETHEQMNIYFIRTDKFKQTGESCG